MLACSTGNVAGQNGEGGCGRGLPGCGVGVGEGAPEALDECRTGRKGLEEIERCPNLGSALLGLCAGLGCSLQDLEGIAAPVGVGSGVLTCSHVMAARGTIATRTSLIRLTDGIARPPGHPQRAVACAHHAAGPWSTYRPL